MLKDDFRKMTLPNSDVCKPSPDIKNIITTATHVAIEKMQNDREKKMKTKSRFFLDILCGSFHRTNPPTTTTRMEQ
jgi:hypothetical protein